jgi:hypothetical protein
MYLCKVCALSTIFACVGNGISTYSFLSVMNYGAATPDFPRVVSAGGQARVNLYIDPDAAAGICAGLDERHQRTNRNQSPVQ